MWRIPSMSIKKLIEKVSDNILAKALCIVAAMLIYLFHQITLIETKTITVPLDVIADGMMMPVSELPPFVKVQVRTKPEYVPLIVPANITASLNLNYYTEAGTVQIPVGITLTPELSLLEPLEVIVKSKKIPVSLDKKELAYIPITPAVSGEAADGYTIQSVTVSPSSVKVIGAAAVLKNITTVYTEKINVKGAATDFSATVKLDNIVSTLKVQAESDFKVSIDIEPLMADKQFRDIVPKVTHLSGNLAVKDAPAALSFKVKGPEAAMEHFTVTSDMVLLDCQEIQEAGKYAVPLRIELPTGIRITEKLPETLTIEVIDTTPEEAAEPQNNTPPTILQAEADAAPKTPAAPESEKARRKRQRANRD